MMEQAPDQEPEQAIGQLVDAGTERRELRRREARLWRALGKSEVKRGPDDLSRIGILSRLSSLVLAQHRLVDAEALARRSLQIFESHLGPDDPGLIMSLVYLFHILKRQNKVGEAAEMLHRALDLIEGAEGPLDRDQAKVVDSLVTLLLSEEQPDEAREVLRRAIAILDDRGAASEDGEIIEILGTMARSCNLGKRYAEAVALFRHTLVLCDKAGEVPEEALSSIRQGLAGALGLNAYEHLDRKDFAQALRLAQELQEHAPKLGYQLAYEVLTAEGRHEEALAAIREGTRRLPGEATLWRMLGDAHNRAAQLPAAESAYRRALALPDTGADAALTRYNLAVTLNLQRRGEETLDLLRAIRREDLGREREDLYWNTRSSLMEVLALTRREGELRSVSTEVLRELTEGGQEGGPSEGSVANLMCLSRALFYGRGDRAGAQACALHAFRIRPDRATATLLRELCGRKTERSRRLWIGIQGQRRKPHEDGPEFISFYDVVADSLEEALGFIRPLEEPDLSETLTISSWTDAGDPPPDMEHKGVYQATSRLSPRGKR